MLGTLGPADSDLLLFPRLAPDGAAVVVRAIDGNLDLWLQEGDQRQRLTTDPSRDDHPQVSPDGTTIVFRSNRSDAGDLYKRLVRGTDPEELLLPLPGLTVPMDWSRDGFLLLGSFTSKTNGDLFILPMQDNAEPYEFLQTEFRETYGRFSPDGQWVAYHSDESGPGVTEVYVRPFFGPDGKGQGAASDRWPISAGGGAYPTWSPDGREIYYLDPSGAMMAVSISVTGNKLVRGKPEMLFRTRIARGGRDRQQGRQYEVAPDGLFLINMELDNDVGDPITLIQNWNSDTKTGE
jgi:Tol biopolymer transport system component